MTQRAMVETSETAGGSKLYRLDIPLQDLLNGGKGGSQNGARPLNLVNPRPLPEPVYPQTEERWFSEREYQKHNAWKTVTSWAGPYIGSLAHRGQLRPMIAYLFNEYKCNLDCHYCWSYNNTVRGMNEEVARASIDWLHSIGNRVLALMGGEPLLRPQFMHKIVYYAAKKGFFVYIPTNGRLLKPTLIDRLGDAGMSAVNLAVDCVDEKPGLPKALNPIRENLEYLVKMQRRYGYLVMLNINITRVNMDDVRELTEIARSYGVGTDYHINEAPMMRQDHFKHADDNDTYLRPEDWGKVDELLDWLMDKHDEGYKMPNPRRHMMKMKELMRGEVEPWPCRAGKNMLIIRPDGTLAPCFPMYSATHDWGVVGADKFEDSQLHEMKKECTKHCLSTCNYILAHAYNIRRVIRWAFTHAAHGFRGSQGSGSMVD